jgi:hypothetical protein
MLALGQPHVRAKWRVVVKAGIERLASLQEISWHQMSRVLWLKDSNTKFFHKVANSHLRSNFMGRLEVDGDCIQH